jgi:hypothetical protein
MKSLTSMIVTIFLLSACDGDNGPPTEKVCALVLGCGTKKIKMTAGPDQRVVDGDTVELKGVTNSFRGGLNYEWRQLTGPAVTILDATLATARFQAPAVSTSTTLTFRFTIRKSGKKSSDDVAVVVEPMSTYALCLEAPLYATTYAWMGSGCKTSSADIVGDSRIATLYRQSEAEPNDSLQTASSLVFPSQVAAEPPAADVEGSIHRADGDGADFFVFTPPTSGDYHVYLCNDPVACLRGTASEDWDLVVFNQDFAIIANTNPGVVYERKVMLPLDAGLPYYVGVIANDTDSQPWHYNLTIISAQLESRVSP